jgi:hypothetical protein
MEDKKLILGQQHRKERSKSVLCRRKGSALMMALGIVLVGSVVATGVYSVSMHFARRSSIQQNAYMNHTTVISAMQTAKCYILQTNSDDATGTVMHVPAVLTSGDIDDLDDLRFSDPNLRYDRVVIDKAGRQVLELRVYDMFYDIDSLKAPLINDAEGMKELPPPIKMASTGASGGSGLTNASDANIPDWGGNEGLSGGSTLSLEKFGAYLVRVKLYAVDSNGSRRQVRTAEEAFIQVLD